MGRLRNPDLELERYGLQTLVSHVTAIDGHNECDKTLTATLQPTNMTHISSAFPTQP